ncbi:hypothetical protein E1180_19435 [Roseibium denhamense]|uniref:DUF3035 domain-containing protein n=1 Tax=Roseibium denhamense TaxID=76305 RepID=A0ABY1P1Y3_9HYPH|nr:hypothetical protein [Roseibium denhamense]MTI07679.1 hypothetical protein [Roseibium denhamense]SMP24469.1 hypothetical protein SAMN06265374_2447 [Roseibium denhamense]
MAQPIRKWATRALAIAGIAALASCQAADGTYVAPDTALVNNLMSGLGAVDPNAKPIEYKPRAPLAMPAEKSNLPEPETNVAGANSEDWPEQNDNSEFRQLQAIYAEQPRGVNPASDRAATMALTPDQVRGFRITGVTGQTKRDPVAEKRAEEINEGSPLTREELQVGSNRLKELQDQQAELAETNQLTRKYLTEPPTAYSTPSDKAPMPDIGDVSAVKSRANKTGLVNGRPVDERCRQGDDQFCY